MDVEIRPIAVEELPELARVFGTVFGRRWPGEALAEFPKVFETERSLCAFDAQEGMVATAGAYSFELTVPGGVGMPAGGLTLVSVLPTHRRRGILRALMQRHFEDVQARGEPVSILTASESLLYGRFGYGLASSAADLEIDRRHAAFAGSVPTGGRVRLVAGDEAARMLPELFDRVRRVHPGQVSRTPAWWDLRLRDPEWIRDGGGPRVNVAYEPAPGQVDGYATYSLKPRWTDNLPDNVAQVHELMAVTPEAAASLWRFCLDLDLTTTVELHNRPLDEPLRWCLADPRRLRTTLLSDFLWLRVLDVPAALAARRYAASGQLVLEVADPLLPENDGRFRVDGGPSGADCARTGFEPDVVLDVAALGAAYLGGVRFSTLGRAGRAREGRPGALARADAMFTSDLAPWCSTDF
ncbi:MAG TPA: GNAT family N-acetyltransferase [Actinomycetes bacterium]|jgi:predicted acetyltransferase|nr:GNAT family N-acetyltransferase [Actinomycetes bacterium]